MDRIGIACDDRWTSNDVAQSLDSVGLQVFYGGLLSNKLLFAIRYLHLPFGVPRRSSWAVVTYG